MVLVVGSAKWRRLGADDVLGDRRLGRLIDVLRRRLVLVYRRTR